MRRHIDEIDFTQLSAIERVQLAQLLLDSVLYDQRCQPCATDEISVHSFTEGSRVARG